MVVDKQINNSHTITQIPGVNIVNEKLRFVDRPVKQGEQEHILRNTILEKDPFLDYPVRVRVRMSVRMMGECEILGWML